jgi:hypothetical protein
MSAQNMAHKIVPTQILVARICKKQKVDIEPHATKIKMNFHKEVIVNNGVS